MDKAATTTKPEGTLAMAGPSIDSDSNSAGRRSDTGRRTRVMIVDDHALLRNGMKMMVENEPHLEVCGEAEDEAGAMEVFRTARPDLVIVDVSLNKGNGLEVIKRIKGHDPSARTIVLSMHDERIYGERALRAGAMGYVSKQDPAGTLLVAIEHVLRGEMFFSDQLTQRLLRSAAGSAAEAGVSPVDRLADRELEAFELTGQGLTTRQIAERMHISTKTVDRYRENIKKKLNFATSNELARFATLWFEQSRTPDKTKSVEGQNGR
jgi:DNA-binding NarL/FixJ family response regulator